MKAMLVGPQYQGLIEDVDYTKTVVTTEKRDAEGNTVKNDKGQTIIENDVKYKFHVRPKTYNHLSAKPIFNNVNNLRCQMGGQRLRLTSRP